MLVIYVNFSKKLNENIKEYNLIINCKSDVDTNDLINVMKKIVNEISKLVLTVYALLGGISLCVMELLRRLHINLDPPRLLLTCLALTIIMVTESFLDSVLSII